MFKVGKVDDWRGTSSKPHPLVKLKPMQQAIINCCSSNDVLVNLPTGYGKSMLYQYPALTSTRCTVVFIPLRALLWDALAEARKLGIPACEFDEPIFQKCFSNDLPKILFLTPEKLFLGKGVLDVLEAMVKTDRVERFVIDEAHCVSEWGSDFRPHYAMLSQLRQRFPRVKILAMTATAPPDIRSDLVKQLSIMNCRVFQASFNRPNLIYSVRKVTRKNIPEVVAGIIGDEFRDCSGIIYCQTIKLCEELHSALKNSILNCEKFHSKIAESKRQKLLNDFRSDKVKVLVATICFGMGINKPNVRFVIHAGVSLTTENYYQESGRAGRDGLPASCILLSYDGQQSSLSFLIDRGDKSLKRTRHQNLNKILLFARQTKQCRRTVMFRILGEQFSTEGCKKMCDICQKEKQKRQYIDITDLATKILRVLGDTNCAPTKKQLAAILKGKKCPKSKYFEELVGIMSKQREPCIEAMVEDLLEQGFLKTACKQMKRQFSVIVLKVDKKQVKKADRILIPKPQIAVSRKSAKVNPKFEQYINKKKQETSSLKICVEPQAPYEQQLVQAKTIEWEPPELESYHNISDFNQIGDHSFEQNDPDQSVQIIQDDFDTPYLSQIEQEPFIFQPQNLKEETQNQKESWKQLIEKYDNPLPNEKQDLKRKLPEQEKPKIPALNTIDLQAVRKKYSGVKVLEPNRANTKKFNLWG